MIDSKSIDNKLKLIKKNLLAIQNDDIDNHEFEQLMISHYKIWPQKGHPNKGRDCYTTILCKYNAA